MPGYIFICQQNASYETPSSTFQSAKCYFPSWLYSFPIEIQINTHWLPELTASDLILNEAGRQTDTDRQRQTDTDRQTKTDRQTDIQTDGPFFPPQLSRKGVH